MKKCISIVLSLIAIIFMHSITVSAATAPTITCENVTGNPGQSVNVEVNISNNPGFSYLELTPDYSTELTFVKATNGSLITDLTIGKQYIWCADENVTANGTLITFTFDIPDTTADGEYSVGFIVRMCGNQEEESVNFFVKNAVVTVKSTCDVHSYDNDCDTTCNECEHTRKITHNYSAATCKKPKTCKVCGATSGSKLTHVSDKGTVTKKATCKATGTKTYKCTLCKATLKTETIAKVAHSYDAGKVTKKATCKATGVKTFTCKVCKVTKKSTIAKITTHTYKNTTTKATLSKNGKIVMACTVCGKVASTTTIKYTKTFKLSTTSYTYNGKVKTPKVYVKDSAGKTLKKNTDYTVTYASGRKNVGTYKVTIKLKGKYSGTKTLTFKINPPKTTVSKLTAGKKSITVNISKKSTQVTGYQIQYSTSKKFTSAKTKTISSYKTTKVALKSLSAKKTYYVRVRTYKTVGGKKYYSGWSTVKSVKTK